MSEAEKWQAAAREFVEWLRRDDFERSHGPIEFHDGLDTARNHFDATLRRHGLTLEEKKECEHEFEEWKPPMPIGYNPVCIKCGTPKS